jgi:hypothetical protein
MWDLVNPRFIDTINFKREKATRGWRKLHRKNKNLYSSSNTLG